MDTYRAHGQTVTANNYLDASMALEDLSGIRTRISDVERREMCKEDGFAKWVRA